MSWLGSAPVVALCVLGLIVPGLPITYLLGLRRLAAVSVAPLVVVAVVAVTAVAAPALGLDWSPVLLLLVLAGLAAVLAGVVVPLRRRLAQPAPGDHRRPLLAATAGVAVAMLLGACTVARAISGPEELVESSDSPFHYNAIVHILNSGNASSFAVDTLGVPDRASGFYPAAWHALGSLLAMSTGISVPAAANILSITIALVVWPLGCVLLMRQLAGPKPLALGLAGLLSVGFGAFPWELLSWGIVWPNLLGLAMLPAGLAVVLAALGMAPDDVIGRRRALVLAPVLLVAMGFAHTNAVMSLGALALAPTAVALGRAVRRRYRAGNRGLAALLAAPFVLFAPTYWLVVGESGLFDGPMSSKNPPYESAWDAVREVTTGATNGWGAGWMISALVLVGAISTFVQRRLRWLVVSHLVACTLFVLAAGVDGETKRLFIGFWYSDSHRLAAIVPTTGVPLAVVGLLSVIWLLRSQVAAWGDRVGGAAGRRSLLVVPAVLAVLFVATGGLYVDDNKDRLLEAYPKVDPLVDQEEYAFFARMDEHVAADEIVAQMPLNGSPAVMTLTHRQVLFPQVNTGRSTADQVYLARHMVDARYNSRVCDIVNRLNVRFMLTNDRPWGNVWDGLTYPRPSRLPGFELVDEGGTFELYRVTACDPDPADPGT